MKVKIGIVCILLFSILITHAQVCTGSLGDPVVNVHFGTGTNPGGALNRSINNYNYTSVPCPEDGFYTIVSSTSNCHNDTWHSLPVDHTPDDVNGYMMLVNASFSPGDFYVDTVRNLCPNTTYEFAAWVLNVLKPSACQGNGIQPNLSFKIETVTGTVLGTYNSGNITPSPSGDWKQYGLFFKTPVAVSRVVIRLTNNAPGGCGNDLVLDDITFRPCGPTVNAAINFNGSTTIVDVCQEDARPYTMNASLSGGYVNPAFQWQVSTDSVTFTDLPGATASTYTRISTAPGNYFYRLSVAEAGNIASASCRVASNVLNIRVNQKPIVHASVNTPVCNEGPLILAATGGAIYSWSGPNGFKSSLASPQSIAGFTSSGKYYVHVATNRGCQNDDSVVVNVFAKASVFAGEDQTICEGNSVLLSATNASTYLWSPVKGLSAASIRNPVAAPLDSAVYILSIKDDNGCAASDTVAINVLKKPVAIAGKEVQLFEGQSATLQGVIRGTGINYFWTPPSFMSNPNQLNPVVSPKDNITYTLHAVSGVGCGSAQDNVFVRVYKKVIVPNAFSPNRDGINDDWNIEALQTYTGASLRVFNRYGALVFQSTGYNKRWDGSLNGKPLPWGTYYYTIDLKNGLPVLSGWVLIVK